MLFASLFLSLLLGGSILGLLDDRVDLLLAVATHLDESLWLDDRQVIEGQVPLFDELLSDLFGHPIDLHEGLHGSLDLAFELWSGHDFDVPATELAG